MAIAGGHDTTIHDRPDELRVGLDLVEIEAVAAALRAPSAARYLERVYTSGEVADCTANGSVNAGRLAARFAAKEATMKALRAGDRIVPWRSIEVRRERDGAPTLALSGAAAELARDARLTSFVVSLTHERDYASAVVVGR